MGGAGFSSEKGSVEGAGDEGPQGAAAGGEVLQDPANEHGRLVNGGREARGDDAVEFRVGLGADDGGEESGEGEDVTAYGKQAK